MSSDEERVALEEALQRIRLKAIKHAETLLLSRDGWTVEQLSHRLACDYYLYLEGQECIDIARQVLSKS